MELEKLNISIKKSLHRSISILIGLSPFVLFRSRSLVLTLSLLPLLLLLLSSSSPRVLPIQILLQVLKTVGSLLRSPSFICRFRHWTTLQPLHHIQPLCNSGKHFSVVIVPHCLGHKQLNQNISTNVSKSPCAICLHPLHVTPGTKNTLVLGIGQA